MRGKMSGSGGKKGGGGAEFEKRDGVSEDSV